MNTIFNVANQYGIDISSRSAAAELRGLVVSAVEQHQFVQLDFDGVRTISGSVADELFGLLALTYGCEWFRKWISVTGLDELPRKAAIEAIIYRLECRTDSTTHLELL